MKILWTFLTSYVLIWLIGCGHNDNPILEQPTLNADSIQCVQAWQQFQLPKDTILTLRYQQPVEIVNGKDKMSITVIDIDDGCSEEGSKTTWGCEARIMLKIQLNGACIYQNKYPLTVGRYSDTGYTVTFRDTNCRIGQSSIAMIGPSSILSFYNSSVVFRQLLPFAKTQEELQQLFSNKERYVIILALQKRCI